MRPAERIAAAIAGARDAGRTALVPFLTAGYPRREAFADDLAAIADTAEVVEVGVPFSDPMADGLTIQRSSHAAIAAGVSLRWILGELEAARERIAAPLVLMSYLNPLLAYGYGRLAERSAAAGVCGYIVPDLPWEESGELREALAPAGLALVQLVTPATPARRLEKLCRASEGFVYAVTVRGITGGGAGLPDGIAEYLDAVKAVSPLPVCAGFGVRSAGDVAAVGAHADGAVVGSALIEAMEAGDDPAEFLAGLRP